MAFTSRSVQRLSSLGRSTAIRQGVRFNSTQSHQPDEVQELAKTLNGMLKNRWTMRDAYGHRNFCNPNYSFHRGGPWRHRRSFFWPLVLFGGGAWAWSVHNKREEARLQMDMALARARASGDYSEVDHRLAAYNNTHCGWGHRSGPNRPAWPQQSPGNVKEDQTKEV